VRVAFSGTFWSQENTGSGQYLRRLWENLQTLPDPDGENDYTLLGYAPGGELLDVPSQQKRIATVPRLVQRGGDNAVKLWWEQAGLPGLLAAEKHTGRPFDVVHWGYFAASLRQPPSPCATVITIHDIIPLVMPEYAPSVPLKAYFRLVSAAAKRATLVFADSEHSRQDILRVLKLPPEKVVTIYLGTDERYRPATLAPDVRTALLQKYGLQGDERLIFYIGGFDVRKNMPMLLEAFGKALPRLKEIEEKDGGGKWTFAIAGKPHSDNPAMFPDLLEPARQAASGTDADRIRFLGRVDEADKAPLYQASEMFVFPSRYEGFGLDPLDALACGIPTICSDASSLPELMGNAARLVSPDRPADWTKAIIELAASSEKRAELAQKGPAQAAKFSWSATAERTLQLYHAAECIMTRGRW
jgi:glycosyltransferase involved in cell wall biosynthesis